MKNAVQGGILTFQEYLKAKNNEWKHIPLHIAVTGNSGVGKSSFINALRGVRKGQKGFAEVNVTETTTDLKGYPHPQNKSLVFWDMPGVGTPKYPKKDYLKAVSFEKYDFFLILTCGRFTENDLWLANQVRSQEKMFYFIRTKIGFDVYNEQRNDPKMHESGITLRIRDDCIRKLKKANFGNPSVFLIDNYDIVKYDFGRLVDTLLTHLPEKKREALALSLTVMTKEVILAKRHALRKRIVVISFASALGGAIPFPGLGATIDTVLIYEEAQEYKRQFGLTEDALLKSNPKYAQLIKDKYVQNIAQLVATVTIDEAAENAVKFGLPILGSILSGTVSYGVSVTVLWRLLNSMADDAIDLNEDMITGLSSDTGV
ncbi:interferon-inducible GTPase 5-like [Mercenaria mercenaria]|uniref:interferon-inducible GTPase 5-like n=1 Tax=Mercenaria mercenaria TaxID=6596 RepID=UPI00234F2293|nr:interferon-inducible GTPase 5-like [Mercenaria mercenaria]